MDADVGSYGTVCYGAIVIAHNATGRVVTGNAGVGKINIADDASEVDHAKEALITITIGVAAPVDADAADGMATAVVSTIKTAFVALVDVVSDSNIVELGAGVVVPVSGVGEYDVAHLQKGFALCGSTAVNIASQTNQVFMRLNKVVVAVFLEVVNGVGKVVIEGADAAGGDATAQAIACQVLNCTANAGDIEVASSILRDGGAEGEHVGA